MAHENGYSGRSVVALITFVLRHVDGPFADNYGVPEGYVVLGLLFEDESGELFDGDRAALVADRQRKVKLCPGSGGAGGGEPDHAFESGIGGHCQRCGYGHK